MMRFYHGSSDELEVGVELRGRGEAYEASWGGTDFYAALERGRPEGMIPHREAVFMVGHPDDVDMAGGATDWCFEVEPAGEVTRHDLNWGSEISSLISEGEDRDGQKVRDAAKAYWAGMPHPNEQVWEYIARTAVIRSVEPWEDFAPGHEPPTDMEWEEWRSSRKEKPGGKPGP